jgi:2-hydroxycyclohexanecarboxyl-CoA dehydrogenase
MLTIFRTKDSEMSQRMAGRVAIITGGAGGIGSATGLLFCEQGASVLLVDRDREACRAAVDAIGERTDKTRIAAAVLDVGQEAASAEAVSTAIGRFGHLDCIVNNAAVRAYEPLGEAKSATWHDVLAVNLLSYAFLAREALPALRHSGAGTIINVSSTYALNMRAGMGQYDVAKAGIISMTRTLAAEEAKHGVRVNAVCPGYTLTPFHIRRAEAAGNADPKSDKLSQCLLGRWADPREVAHPILWLASAEASYVTGTSIMVDGGIGAG